MITYAHPRYGVHKAACCKAFSASIFPLSSSFALRRQLAQLIRTFGINAILIRPMRTVKAASVAALMLGDATA